MLHKIWRHKTYYRSEGDSGGNKPSQNLCLFTGTKQTVLVCGAACWWGAHRKFRSGEEAGDHNQADNLRNAAFRQRGGKATQSSQMAHVESDQSEISDCINRDHEKR